MFDFEDLKTDPVKEQDGVWFDFGRSARVKIARMGNPKYRAYLRRLAKANKAALEADDEHSAELSEKLMEQAMAATIVLDWQGFTSAGEPFPYSRENAQKALKVRDFKERVLNHANEMEAYKVRQEADDLEN